MDETTTSHMLMGYLDKIDSIVWGTPLQVLLIGTGLFLTLRLGLIQVRSLVRGLRLAFSKEDTESEGDISHFKALMTALVIISVGVWDSGLDSSPLTVTAFRTGLPGVWGGLIVSCGLVLFAFSTILGWAYYGEKCLEYLFGIKMVLPYRILWVAVVFCSGALGTNAFVWTFADIMNGLMAVPNLLCLLLLSGVIAAETKRWGND